jgi:signal transduction histidine kinase
MKRLIFLFIWMTAPCLIWGQNVDSLEQVFNDTKLPVAERVSACNNIVAYLTANDVQKSKQYAFKGITMSEKAKLDSLSTRLYYNLGVIYYHEEQYDSTKIFLDKIVDILSYMKDEAFEGKTCQLYGLMYQQLSQIEKSVEYYEKAIKLYEKTDNQQLMASVYQNIGLMYSQTGNHQDMAEKYFLKAKEILSDLPANRTLAVVLNSLGYLYYLQEKNDEAYKNTMESIKIFESLGNKNGEVDSKIILAQLYSREKKYSEALKLAHQCLQDAEDIGIFGIKYNSIDVLADIYYAAGNYKQCEEYLHKELTLLESTTHTRQYALVYFDLVHVYAQLGQKDKIVEALEKYNGLMHEALRTDVQNAYSEMEIKYETEKKELEIERQQHIIGRQNMQRLVLAGGLTLAVVILVLLWFMLRYRSRRNRALTEMNATKDKFFSIISHDLKNPALAQRDALKLLIENAGSWDAALLADYYNELLKSAEGQVELLYNLLNWAQVQTGRMPYTPAPFNLVTRLRPDIALLRKMAESKDITLSVEMPEDALVTGDANMLSTVIRNLLTNAVKFTGKGGRVLLAVEASGDGKHTVSVSDTGTGMSEEQRRNLFRLDSPYSGKGTAGEQGSGLGLIVCRELLEKHGSALHVESREGVGSRFWFEI